MKSGGEGGDNIHGASGGIDVGGIEVLGSIVNLVRGAGRSFGNVADRLGRGGLESEYWPQIHWKQGQAGVTSENRRRA